MTQMTSDHTSKRMTTYEDGRTTITETTYTEDDKPIEGATWEFNTQEEAEYFMATGKTHDNQDNANDQPQPQTGGTAEISTEGRSQYAQEPNVEKPASQMTEADAVALNGDVHVATPNMDTERIVTQGERDQTEAGLQPDPSKGNPYIEKHS